MQRTVLSIQISQNDGRRWLLQYRGVLLHSVHGFPASRLPAHSAARGVAATAIRHRARSGRRTGYASCFEESGIGREHFALGVGPQQPRGANANLGITASQEETMNKTQGQRQRMDLIELARESGMAVLLDAKIGREQYVSVSGSLAALARFADAVRGKSEADGPEDKDR